MNIEELDKLAEKYQDDNTIIRYYGPGNGTVPEYNKTMAEVFKDGWNACKEQMLKGAVEGKVFMSFAPGHNQIVMADVDLPTNTKVRIIVLPKEDEK